MKVIFLDNDGVICIASDWGGQTRKWNEWLKTNPKTLLMSDAPIQYRSNDFDKNAVRILNEILIETGAEIVISSDWKKFDSLDTLGDYYESQGILKRPIAMTKHFIGCERPESFSWIYKECYEQQRSLEINQFIIDNPNITNWVAVDDLDISLNSNYGVSNFVRTKNMNEGITESGIKEKIIEFLNKKNMKNKLILLTLVGILFVSCADVSSITFLDPTEHTYGFWGGVWHGMIMAPAFIGSLFDRDIAIYAVNNDGVWYNFGFVGGFGFVIRFIKGFIRGIITAINNDK